MIGAFLLFAALPIVVAFAGKGKLMPTCCGIAACVLAIWIEIALDHLIRALGVVLSPGARAALLFGLVEELLKYFALLSMHGFERKPKDLLQASVFCAIGFASLENLGYTSGFWDAFGDSSTFRAASLMRFFLPFAMHVLAGPLLVSGHVISGSRPVAGIALATLFHGTYNAVLATIAPSLAIKASCILLIGGFVAVAGIFRRVSNEVCEA